MENKRNTAKEKKKENKKYPYKVRRKNRTTSKLLTLIFCILLLVGTVSAFDFDNKLKYENDDLKVTIENIWGLPLIGSDLGSIELTSHKSVDEVKQVYQGDDVLVMSYNFNFKEVYEDGIGDISFINMTTGKEINKDYNLKYLTSEEVSVNDYENKCINKISTNGTSFQECNKIIIDSHLENKEKWLPYSSKDIPKSEITLGLFTEVKNNDYIDGVWEIAGKEITKHATWTASLNTDLINYFAFEETSGPVIDLIGTSNGVNHGTTRGVTGLIGNAFDFEAADNDSMNITSVASMNNLNNWSLSLWFKAESIPEFPRLFNKGDNTDTEGFSLEIADSPDVLDARVGTGIGNEKLEGFSINIAEWYHVVLLYDGINASFYKNGVRVATQTLTYGGTSETITLGVRPDFFGVEGRHFDGIIDEMGLWNRTLSQSEITDLYNGGSGITYPTSSIILNSPADNYISNINEITFNSTAIVTGILTLVNMSLYTNKSGTWEITNTTTGLSGTSHTQTWNNTFSDGDYILWNAKICNSNGNCEMASANRTVLIDTTIPTISITSPESLITFHITETDLELNVTVIDSNLDTCWYDYNSVNTTYSCSSGVQQNETFTSINGIQTITVWVNDTAGSINNTIRSWTYIIKENLINYSNETFEGENTTIIGNFTLSSTPTNITLIYNNIEYIPIIISDGDEYILTSTIQTPSVTQNINYSFYYKFYILGDFINSIEHNQTVKNIQLTTICAGNYSVMNITNYDEETRTIINGTVDYLLTLSNDITTLSVLNGSENGTLIQLCSVENLSTSSSYYSLELKYHDTGYMYETYNIATTPTSNLPVSINLYYLNISKGIEFKIKYKDFKYLTHSGAIIQIQRQYLSLNQYKNVEIPIIGDDGISTGSFVTDGTRYKLIIIENGVILDTFDNVFPKCQNIVLGTCEISIIGEDSSTTTSNGDFEYTLVNDDYNLILTYIIPSGTPKTVVLNTTQNSRFLNDISSCYQTTYASGGTLTCSFNTTVGDSELTTFIIVNNVTELQGDLLISEDVNVLFLANNYFIGFILILTLVLIFVTSGVFMVLSATLGVFYLAFIYLIKSNSVNIIMVSTSLMWLIIAAIIIVFKLAQKEERT